MKLASLFFAISAFLIFSKFSSTAHADSSKFIIEAIGGADAVDVKRNATKMRLKKSDMLQLGDSIETDASTVVDVRYPDNSLVRIGVNSSFLLEKKNPAQKELVTDWASKLMKGFVRVLVPESKQKNAFKFELDTPAGTMGVRGTEFVVEHQNKQTQLHTLKGEVLIGPANALFSDSAKFVAVGKSQKNSINIGAQPSAAEKFPMDEYLKKIESPSEKNPFANLRNRKSGMDRELVKNHPKKSSGTNTSASQTILPKFVAKKSDSKDASADKEAINEAYLKSIIENDVEGVEKNAAAGAEIDFTLEESGFGPMHIAVTKKNNAELVAKLKSLGVAMNRKSYKGFTPLMLAAETSDDLDEIKYLVANGADMSLTNSEGKTAYDIALANKHPETAALLKRLLEEKNKD